MNKNYPLIMLACIYLSGCATVVSRYQILSIDSSSRGAIINLKQTKNEPTAPPTTPAFIRVERESTIPFSLQSPDSKTRLDVLIDCKFRWGTVLGGNLAYFYFWPLGVAIDYFSGNAFECPLQYNASFRFPRENKLKVPDCKIYFLAFPIGTPQSRMRFIWERWNESKTSGCDRIVDFQDMVDSSDRYQLHSESEFLTKSQRKRFYLVGYTFKITHLVLIRENSLDETNQDYKYKVVDLHTEQKVEENSVKVNPEKIISYNSGFKKTALHLGMDFLPNSISYAPSYFSTVEIDSSPEIILKNVDIRKSSIKPLFLNWSLRNIDHPSGYDDWDLSFRFSPDIALNEA